MKKRILISLILFAFFAVNFGTLLTMKVRAQTGNGFSISPPSFDLNANPGDIISNSIKIQNDSSNLISLRVRTENFVAYGDGGQINLTEEDSSYSINKWVKFDSDTITVNPSETSLFNFTIKVPEVTEPGSHYGSIVFSSNPQTGEGSGAAVVQEIGSIILIRIPGDVIEEASLINFKSEKDIFTEPLIKINTLIENAGTVHFKPYGTITIRDLFGNKIQTIEVEPRNILPGSRRVFDEDFDFDKIGYFKAELQMFYKEGEKTISSETAFFSLYTSRLIPVLLIIVGFGVFGMLFRKRIVKALKVIIKG